MLLLVASGRYWPISFLADGPSPGNEVTNLRMLVGLWANAQARPFPTVWYRAAPAPASATRLRKSRLLLAMQPPVGATFSEASPAASQRECRGPGGFAVSAIGRARRSGAPR